MPLKIMVNDITRVKADIIVNSANPRPLHGGGIDTAIYRAAGEKELLAARSVIGKIERGNIAVTDAFNLDANNIIHAVGPKWKGGSEGELNVLSECYRKSLRKAVELDAGSIAFPVIATGKNGVPQREALFVAMSVFCDFLSTRPMNISLVVGSERLFDLSKKVVAEFESFTTDANAISRGEIEYVVPRECTSNKILLEQTGNCEKEKSFGDRLRELIDSRGMTDPEVYTKAQIHRQTFNKIINGTVKKPKKETVFVLCIVLELDLEESIDLLSRAGRTFDPSCKFDAIIKEAIIKKKYDLDDLNDILDRETGMILGNAEK